MLIEIHDKVRHVGTICRVAFVNHWKKLIKTIPKQNVGNVMVFSEKPAENHHFSQKLYDGLSNVLVLKTRTIDNPAESYQ